MRLAIGRRIFAGAISETNSAVPRATGVPITRATTDVATVPMMKGSAPKTPSAGAQWVPTTHPRPWAFQIGQESCMKRTTMSASASSSADAPSMATRRATPSEWRRPTSDPRSPGASVGTSAVVSVVLRVRS